MRPRLELTLLPLLLSSLSLVRAEPALQSLRDGLLPDLEAFATIEMPAPGKTAAFDIELGDKTAEFEGDKFDGIRIKCPKLEDGSDRDERDDDHPHEVADDGTPRAAATTRG